MFREIERRHRPNEFEPFFGPNKVNVQILGLIRAWLSAAVGHLKSPNRFRRSLFVPLGVAQTLSASVARRRWPERVGIRRHFPFFLPAPGEG